jgi:hypothetical protein
MNGVGEQAAFYRGYLPDDRCLVPLTVLLSQTLALWLLVYLVATVAEAHHDAGAGRVASVTFIHDRSAAYSPISTRANGVWLDAPNPNPNPVDTEETK